MKTLVLNWLWESKDKDFWRRAFLVIDICCFFCYAYSCNAGIHRTSQKNLALLVSPCLASFFIPAEYTPLNFALSSMTVICSPWLLFLPLVLHFQWPLQFFWFQKPLPCCDGCWHRLPAEPQWGATDAAGAPAKYLAGPGPTGPEARAPLGPRDGSCFKFSQKFVWGYAPALGCGLFIPLLLWLGWQNFAERTWAFWTSLVRGIIWKDKEETVCDSVFSLEDRSKFLVRIARQIPY